MPGTGGTGGTGGVAVPAPGSAGFPSNARTSTSRNRRCPPNVRIADNRPSFAHLVTVFGSTRNNAATSAGVNNPARVPITAP